jgi:hypothetical protein
VYKRYKAGKGKRKRKRDVNQARQAREGDQLVEAWSCISAFARETGKKAV